MSSEPTETNCHTNQTYNLANKPSAIDAVRALGLVLGPSLVLELFALLGTLAVVSVWSARPREGLTRQLRPLMILGAVLSWMYAFFICPWHLRWGATGEELGEPLPGDELLPHPAIESTWAITANAPVELSAFSPAHGASELHPLVFLG
jgi:hypothetical protein